MSNALTSMLGGRRTTTSHGGNFQSIFRELIAAIVVGRQVAGEYERQIAKGVEPSAALRKVFAEFDKS